LLEVAAAGFEAVLKAQNDAMTGIMLAGINNAA
jgi:hypothetical protein